MQSQDVISKTMDSYKPDPSDILLQLQNVVSKTMDSYKLDPSDILLQLQKTASSGGVTYPIQTKKSFLSLRSLPVLPNNITMEKIILELEPHLIVRPKIMMRGKVAHQNRSLAFFSNESIGYKYSGYLAKSVPLTESTKTILEFVSNLYGTKFNGILVNKYENGEDSIGRHSDDEKDLSDVGVVAISYGAVRKFRIREKAPKSDQNKTMPIIKDIPTDSGVIMHMGGDFQKEFTHEIPVEKTVKNPRYSLTFRHHKK